MAKGIAKQRNCAYARRYALYTIGLGALDSGQSWSLFWSLSWSLLWSLFWSLFWIFYVVVVAVVVVIVDVDDEEGEGGGEDAQRRKSNNPNLKGFLSCMNLYHIHIVRMQCCARCMFFRHSYGPFIASTLPLRKLMLRVDDRSRLYADALQRRF